VVIELDGDRTVLRFDAKRLARKVRLSAAGLIIDAVE